MRSVHYHPSISILKRSASLLCAAAILCCASQASAAGDEKIELQTDEDGYGYVFGDDPLTGVNASANVAQVTILRRGTRRTLIRPRTHFVAELLKSVEMI